MSACPTCGQKVRRPGNRFLALFGIYPALRMDRNWLLRQRFVQGDITAEEFEREVLASDD